MTIGGSNDPMSVLPRGLRPDCPTWPGVPVGDDNCCSVEANEPSTARNACSSSGVMNGQGGASEGLAPIPFLT